MMVALKKNKKYFTLAVTLLFYSLYIQAQKLDTTEYGIHFKSNIAITNNGFSFIPSLSLGKPAAIITLAIGAKKLSFDPEFRFSLEGKPWSFIFIWRYKLINTQKLQLTAGVHLPALNFKTVSVVKNGIVQDIIQNQRFISAELSPSIQVSKNIQVGFIYLYGKGIESDAPQNTHFIALKSSITSNKLCKNYIVKFTPQVFYLNMDKVDGYYASWGCSIVKDNFPLSLSTMMYTPISTKIIGKNFDWNISINYSFNKNFVSK